MVDAEELQREVGAKVMELVLGPITEGITTAVMTDLAGHFEALEARVAAIEAGVDQALAEPHIELDGDELDRILRARWDRVRVIVTDLAPETGLEGVVRMALNGRAPPLLISGQRLPHPAEVLAVEQWLVEHTQADGGAYGV